ITRKALTVTGAVAQNKQFDGNTTAQIDLTGASLVGVEAGDAVTFSGGGTFATSAIGTSRAVTANLVLAGVDAGNYTLTQPTGLSADITVGALLAVDDTVDLPANALSYTSMTIQISTLLQNDGQGNGNATFALGSTLNGYTATRRGGLITIHKVGGLVAGDVFEYTLTEDQNADGTIDPVTETTTAKVTLASVPSLAGTLDVFSSGINGSNFEVVFVTMPGARIQVQKTTTLSPANWTNVGGPMTADGNGYVVHSESTSSGSGFFRAYRVP
ncbi:MAG: hypothetical protein RLZZ112_1357, partial [Verrucomicrobiota bacterium]